MDNNKLIYNSIRNIESFYKDLSMFVKELKRTIIEIHNFIDLHKQLCKTFKELNENN